MANITQKITPFLTFDNQAEAAAKFYTSIFKDSSLDGISYYGEGAPAPKGSVMTVAFTLFGLKFTALNAGPHFKFSDAVSFTVSCENQEEVDYYWNKLTEGGQEVACGWLRDKFGLAWQITPTRLIELMTDKDKEKASRVMQAMMNMVKIDIPALEKAAEGK
ncbi:MAG: VOC family protein [Parafilimonas sp.]|nr:VOC family protein [Parafilimonas sp.]